MIKKIKLKFGSSQTKPPLDTDLTPITVFVGPNNSGKSKVLIEIEKFCKDGTLNTTNVILTDLEFNNISDPETEINNHTLSPKLNESLPLNHIIFGKENSRHQLQKPELVRILMDANANKNAYTVYYVSFNTIRIDGGSRINF